MLRTRSIALIVSLLPALATGCFIGSAPIPAPARPLEPAEQRQVLACQDKIAKEVRKLNVVTFKQFGRCLQPAIDLAIEEERELDTSTLPDFFERRERLRAKCEDFFEIIGKASTKMIDAIVDRCAPVESLILGDPSRGDPLGLKAPFLQDAPSSVTDMASRYCGGATATAELLASGVYLRTADVAWRFEGTFEEEDIRDWWRAFLDPRCERYGLDF